jgi:hypothetical protein
MLKSLAKWFLAPPSTPRILPAAAVLCILAFLSVWLMARPATADVSGTWTMTVEAPEGTAHPTITLKQDGEKVTGTYQGRMGESTLDGTIKGSEIRFSVTLKFQDVAYVITYVGTVSDDAMKGTARFGDAGTGSWSATRKKM